MNFIKQSVEMLSFTPNPEKLIELAGRTAYKSEDRITDDSSKSFIKTLIKRRHESVLEHANATMRIITDRGISHEIVRHRMASYTQESSRYCNYSKDRFDGITFMEPDKEDKDIIGSERDFYQQLENEYMQRVVGGVLPQIARDILPNILKTEIIMTCNFRSWRHFIRIRGAKSAHPRIIKIAKMIHSKLLEISPACFEDLSSIFIDSN